MGILRESQRHHLDVIDISTREPTNQRLLVLSDQASGHVADETLRLPLFSPFFYLLLCPSTSVVAALERLILVSRIEAVPERDLRCQSALNRIPVLAMLL